MRNLVEYPVTKDEIMENMDRLSQEILKEGGVGDMRPLLLREASKLIESQADTISGLESDLFLAVSTAFKRGATEWTRLNYPKYYERLTGEA